MIPPVIQVASPLMASPTPAILRTTIAPCTHIAAARPGDHHQCPTRPAPRAGCTGPPVWPSRTAGFRSAILRQNDNWFTQESFRSGSLKRPSNSCGTIAEVSAIASFPLSCRYRRTKPNANQIFSRNSRSHLNPMLARVILKYYDLFARMPRHFTVALRKGLHRRDPRATTAWAPRERHRSGNHARNCPTSSPILRWMRAWSRCLRVCGPRQSSPQQPR